MGERKKAVCHNSMPTTVEIRIVTFVQIDRYLIYIHKPRERESGREREREKEKRKKEKREREREKEKIRKKNIEPSFVKSCLTF